MQWTHWAESAEQNKKPIAEALQPFLAAANSVLEIGSGTGQHAVHFAGLHPHLRWQPSEHPHNLNTLQQNLSCNGGSNIESAIALDASAPQWPALTADVIYSANTLHIMSWASVQQLFAHVGALLDTGQRILLYGPFRFADRPFAASNTAFDQYLQQADPLSGIRDIDALVELGQQTGLRLESDIEMPANNHILVWQGH